jgi:serine/threonine protein kinase
VSRKLGPYQIHSELGRGAMAQVWRAHDPVLDRDVAIKEPMLPKGVDAVSATEFGARFVREAKAAARLNHPGIVTIYAADIYDGRPAIVMELVEGEP